MVKSAIRFTALSAAFFALVIASLQPLPAQEGMSRVELRRTDLTGSDTTEVIMSRIEAAPGASMPRHIHHGDEFLYVIVGGTIQAPGGEPIALRAGDALHFPREVPHGGFTVIGEDTLEVLTVHVVDKGKPLMELVE
jgi:quercetin dioxygenase-like cupin family protein